MFCLYETKLEYKAHIKQTYVHNDYQENIKKEQISVLTF